MKNPNADIYEMRDTLSLPVAAQRFMELAMNTGDIQNVADMIDYRGGGGA